MYTRIVTFLGLGGPVAPHYDPCVYEWEGKQSVPTPIHDVATILGVEGPVTLVVLGTEEVRERWFGSDKKYESYLRQALPITRDLHVQFELLPFGREEQERWSIFQKVVDLLNHECLPWEEEWLSGLSEPVHSTKQESSAEKSQTEEDALEPVESEVDSRQGPEQIFLDITHGFRSQPFFAASAVSFVASQHRRMSEKVQDFPILRILYAAFERGKERAPVWELTQLLEVMEWDAAIDGLMRYGRSDDLERLLGTLQKRAIREARENEVEPRDYPRFKAFGTTARSFADALVTVRIPKLPAQAASLHKQIIQNAETLKQWVPPLERQLDHLTEWTQEMQAEHIVSPEGIQASLQIAKVYLETERYSELSALLRETLVSAWTLRTLPPEKIAQPEEKVFPKQREKMDRELGKLGSMEGASGLPECFYQLTNLRNDVQHGAFRNSARSAKKVRQELPRSLETIRAWLTPSLFLNISNHPHEKWNTAQKEAVHALGFEEIQDLEGGFPQVDPGATTQEVEELAKQVVRQVAEQCPGGAFVAGEYGLALSLVAQLQKAGIPCYSTATHRKTEETLQPDGSTHKKVRYEFVRWRPYPIVWR